MGFLEVAAVVASAGMDEDSGNMFSFLGSIHRGLILPVLREGEDCGIERTKEWNISLLLKHCTNDANRVDVSGFLGTESRIWLGTVTSSRRAVPDLRRI